MYYIIFWDKLEYQRRPLFYDRDEGLICVYPSRKVALREAAVKAQAMVLPYHGAARPTRNPQLFVGPIDSDGAG